jgi:hypothetical protein
MPETIIATIPQAEAHTVVEVVLLHDDSPERWLALRSLVWSADVGWYRTQTLHLDHTAVRALQRALEHAQGQWTPRRPAVRPTNVIPFPCVARTQRVRGTHT